MNASMRNAVRNGVLSPFGALDPRWGVHARNTLAFTVPREVLEPNLRTMAAFKQVDQGEDDAALEMLFRTLTLIVAQNYLGSKERDPAVDDPPPMDGDGDDNLQNSDQSDDEDDEDADEGGGDADGDGQQRSKRRKRAAGRSRTEDFCGSSYFSRKGDPKFVESVEELLDDNEAFAGLRYWLCLVDPKFNPGRAVGMVLRKNQRYIQRSVSRTHHGGSKLIMRDFMKTHGYANLEDYLLGGIQAYLLDHRRSADALPQTIVELSRILRNPDLMHRLGGFEPLSNPTCVMFPCNAFSAEVAMVANCQNVRAEQRDFHRYFDNRGTFIGFPFPDCTSRVVQSITRPLTSIPFLNAVRMRRAATNDPALRELRAQKRAWLQRGEPRWSAKVLFSLYDDEERKQLEQRRHRENMIPTFNDADEHVTENSLLNEKQALALYERWEREYMEESDNAWKQRSCAIHDQGLGANSEILERSDILQLRLKNHMLRKWIQSLTNEFKRRFMMRLFYARAATEFWETITTSSDIPESFLAGVQWYMSLPEHKRWSQMLRHRVLDLSVYGNMCFMETIMMDRGLGVVTHHDLLALAMCTADSASIFGTDKVLNLLMLGMHGSGKSMIIKLLQMCMFPGLVQVDTYRTARANAVGEDDTHLCSARHEADVSDLGLNQRGRQEIENSHTKEQISERVFTTRSISLTEDGKRTRMKYVSAQMNSHLWATNWIAHRRNAIMDRFFIYFLTATERAEFSRLDKLRQRDYMCPKSDVVEPTVHYFQLKSFFVALVLQAINAHIIEPPNTDIAEVLLKPALEYVSDKYHLNTEGLRTYGDLHCLCSILTVNAAVGQFLLSEQGQEYWQRDHATGKYSAPFDPIALMKIQSYLVVTQEIGVRALTLLSSHYLPVNEMMLVQAMIYGELNWPHGVRADHFPEVNGRTRYDWLEFQMSRQEFVKRARSLVQFDIDSNACQMMMTRMENELTMWETDYMMLNDTQYRELHPQQHFSGFVPPALLVCASPDGEPERHPWVRFVDQNKRGKERVWVRTALATLDLSNVWESAVKHVLEREHNENPYKIYTEIKHREMFDGRMTTFYTYNHLINLDTSVKPMLVPNRDAWMRRDNAVYLIDNDDEEKRRMREAPCYHIADHPDRAIMSKHCKDTLLMEISTSDGLLIHPHEAYHWVLERISKPRHRGDYPARRMIPEYNMIKQDVVRTLQRRQQLFEHQVNTNTTEDAEEVPPFWEINRRIAKPSVRDVLTQRKRTLESLNNRVSPSFVSHEGQPQSDDEFQQDWQRDYHSASNSLSDLLSAYPAQNQTKMQQRSLKSKSTPAAFTFVNQQPMPSTSTTTMGMGMDMELDL